MPSTTSTLISRVTPLSCSVGTTDRDGDASSVDSPRPHWCSPPSLLARRPWPSVARGRDQGSSWP
eukprot:9474946-Pyramimonas_sp.AAC.1